MVRASRQTKGFEGAFFPPNETVYKMSEGTEVHFKDEYGKYFRFPLDRGPVTLEIREKDTGLRPILNYDVIAGSLILDPEQIAKNSTGGIEGGSAEMTTPAEGETEVPPSIEGGAAIFDGPAVVEIANSYYGRHNGEGAAYFLCYSVGMEDWCKPATTEGQGDPDDVVVVPDTTYYTAPPLYPVSYDDAWSSAVAQGGVLPILEEMQTLRTTGKIPQSWPGSNYYWTSDGYAVDIDDGMYMSASATTTSNYYTCKITGGEDGVEEWIPFEGGEVVEDLGHFYTFPAGPYPDGAVTFAEAKAACEAQGGELPSDENLQDLVYYDLIPESWPQVSCWTRDRNKVSLSSGDLFRLQGLDAVGYFSCKDPDPDHMSEGASRSATKNSRSSNWKRSSRRRRSNASLINLNMANVRVLALLPGIDEKLAEAIVAARMERPFSALADMERVPGIGPEVRTSLEGLVTC